MEEWFVFIQNYIFTQNPLQSTCHAIFLNLRCNWANLGLQLIQTSFSFTRQSRRVGIYIYVSDWQVIAAARHGYQAHGYELNYWLVWYSRIQARIQGLHGKATFSKADLWKVGINKTCWRTVCTTWPSIISVSFSNLYSNQTLLWFGQCTDENHSVLTCTCLTIGWGIKSEMGVPTINPWSPM